MYLSTEHEPIALEQLTRQWRRSTVVIVNFEYISFASVSIIDFEQVNVSWDFLMWCDFKDQIMWLNAEKSLEEKYESVVDCDWVESLKEEINTAKNTVISPNFLVWKFSGKAQFPRSSGRFARNYAETVPFRKIFTQGN